MKPTKIHHRKIYAARSNNISNMTASGLEPSSGDLSLQDKIYAKRRGETPVAMESTVEREGIAAATARANEVLNHEEAIGRETVAKELLSKPNLSAMDCIELLAKFPRDNDAKLRATGADVYAFRKADTNA